MTHEPDFIGLYASLANLHQFTFWQLVSAFAASPLEWLALLTTLASVILAARQNILSWPIGLVGVVLYGILFHGTYLYSDALLQAYFFVTQFYGWYYWAANARKEGMPGSFWQVFARLHREGLTLRQAAASEPEVQLRAVGPMAFGLLCVAIVLASLWLAGPMASIGAALPHWDTFVLVASVAAQLLLTRKYAEAWLLWVAVDVIAIGVYGTKELYPTAVLYMGFLAIAAYNAVTWHVLYHKQRGSGRATTKAA